MRDGTPVWNLSMQKAEVEKISFRPAWATV